MTSCGSNKKNKKRQDLQNSPTPNTTTPSDSKLSLWSCYNTEQLLDLSICQIMTHKAQNPRTQKEAPFYVLKMPDWVIILALKSNQELIFVKQFRHGIRDITLEFPAGLVDLHENPLDAAKRELREETGFTAQQWKKIGTLHPNPAIQDNQCHIYLAQNLHQTGTLELDEEEDIELKTCRSETIPQMVQDGILTHSLTVAAYFLYREFKE